MITVQRAINLLLGGKAIAVEMTGLYLRTVRDRFEVPSVIALRSYVNVPRRKSHWSRKGVLVRDDYTCIYCGIKLGAQVRGKVLSKRDFTIDHIIPRCKGGRDTWSNTACACATVQPPQRQSPAQCRRHALALGTQDTAHQLPGYRARFRAGNLETLRGDLASVFPDVLKAVVTPTAGRSRPA